MFQTCHLVLGLPRGPAEDPGRRPCALAPRSHPPKRLSVVHSKPPWPLSAGETDQVLFAFLSWFGPLLLDVPLDDLQRRAAAADRAVAGRPEMVAPQLLPHLGQV